MNKWLCKRKSLYTELVHIIYYYSLFIFEFQHNQRCGSKDLNQTEPNHYAEEGGAKLGLSIKSGTRNPNQIRTEKSDPLSDPKCKNT